jgi:folate-binding protein YgfZ
MPIALLADRGVVRISGPDARSFLDGLFTCDMDKVGADRPRYGALLTPQGKIVADFLVVQADGEMGGSFYLDVPRLAVADLVKRLTLYRLRAKIAVDDLSATLAVAVGWGADRWPEGLGVAYRDPRDPELGDRLIAEKDNAEALATAPETEFAALRVARGVPEGGVDFAYNDAFPHEADMDQLEGVDFDKGCYVGQEVVSRMQHRGTVRTRIVPVAVAEGAAPAPGSEILAAGKPAGRIGTSGAAGAALALVRLDRIEDALAEGAPVEADGRRLTLVRPPFARFPIPGAAAKAET